MIFHNNGDEKIFISSADWMTRNLDHRIEVATPILSEVLKERIKNIIRIQLSDNVKARIIDQTQKNEYVKHRHKGRKDKDKEKEKDETRIRSQVEIRKYLASVEEMREKAYTEHQ